MADLLPQNSFAALTLRIGKGRTPEDRQRAGDLVFKAATDTLAPLYATPHFALTLEIIEIDPGFNWKKNAVDPRLRAR